MVITVSREAESGAEEIARLVAEREGLQVADRAMLERIAQQEGAPISSLTLFEETAPGAVEALIVEWRTSISQAVYLRRLVRILLLLEGEDNMLIMGRGAAFVLTDPGALHVRMVAPMPCRIARLMQRQGVSCTVAERMLARNDAERAKFVRQAFGADIESPSHYDLVVNTAELSARTAAEIISLSAERKSERRIAVSTSDDFLSHMSRMRRRPRMPRVSETTWERCQRRPLV